MAKSKFFEQIKGSLIEREVEDVYNKGISLYFPDVDIKHPFACDGFVDTTTENNKMLKLIIEYKLDEDFTSRAAIAKVLLQVLYYMKQFEINGEILPNVILVGDINECFVMHSNAIIKYLDEDLDWSIAPSQAYKENAEVILKMAEDNDIAPFVYSVNDAFSFQAVAEKIKALAAGVKRYVHITEHNISVIYDYFTKRVVKKSSKVLPNDLVAIFMGVILDGENYYQHPKKNNVLVTPMGNVNIDGAAYKAYCEHFSREYTIKEKDKFAEISDRLIEDTNRRNKGEFYTPTLFVDYAHQMISNTFGADWREKYVVWDNCYDGETEYLSENGWKKISEYDGGKVMQYKKDGSAEFVTPLRYINQEYNGEMLHYISSQMDILCTPDHNFVVKNDKKDRNQELFKISANELLDRYNKVKNTHLIVPKTFNYDGKLEIDENILRLAIAINADGTYAPKTTLSNNKGRTKRNTRFTANDTSVRDCFCVMVAKERKKERMRILLSNAKIEWKEKEYGAYTYFTFHFPYFNPKQFPNEWYNLSNKCKEVIMEEILLWDGSLTETKFGTRKSYSTSKKSDADFIAFVGASCGYGVNVREDRRSKNINYLLSFTRIKNTKISTKSSFTKEINTDGRVYCFEVESGMLIVRRNGKIFISSNCAGSKNLTRDYRFKELYSSTLEQAELEISKRYNPEATSFQYDFLNDPLEKLPEGLLKAFEENRPILFFINPPYATSASGKGKEGKGGVSNTMVYEQMMSDKIGGASQNLYLQFLYRIMMIKGQHNLTNVHICLFSPLNFLSGANRKVFRNAFFSDFAFGGGVLFKASNFADVANTWGIGFSIWNSGVNADNSNFKFKLIDNVDGEIEVIGEKVVYNVDNDVKASDWLRTELKEIKEKKVVFPHLSNPLRVVEKENQTLLPDSLGSICILANNVDKSVQGVAIFSSIQTQGTACISNSIIPQNFDKVVSLFAARKLVESNWANSQDEYLAPNTNSEKWQEFVNDSIVFSLFNSHSQQSSLRKVEYKGKLWDIKNEFFFMPKNEILELADKCSNDECYMDARTDNERYVYELLQRTTLSPEAQAVLDYARDLTRKTFKYRKLFDESHPDYQINGWDIGYFQLKALWKEYAPKEFKEFKELFKNLANKMRPMVYELGFLK